MGVISRRPQNINISARRTRSPKTDEEKTGTYREGMKRRIRYAANRKVYKKEENNTEQRASTVVPSDIKASFPEKISKHHTYNFWSSGPKVNFKSRKYPVRGPKKDEKLSESDTEWEGKCLNQDSEEYTGRGKVFGLKKQKSEITKSAGIIGTIFFHFLMLAKAVVSAITNIIVVAAVATLIIVITTIGTIQSATYNFLVDEESNIASYISMINNDFSENIKNQKAKMECEEIKITGKLADWKEVVAFWWVFAINNNGASENGYESLKKVFYEFNTISYSLQEKNDKKILNVSIEKHTLNEMHKQYEFSGDQIAYVDELLNDDELWEKILSTASPAVFAGNLVWPVTDYYYVTSSFGPRDLLGMSFHHGMDIGCPIGTPVHACADGIVVDRNMSRSIGLYVQIDHGAYKSIYMHNSSIEVQVGQEVKAGDVIAYSGNTGQSTGPHCHIGISTLGEYTDPAFYFGLPAGFTGDATEYMK